MSYGNYEEKKRPGCNPIFLIAIAIAAFTLFNNLQPQNGANQGNGAGGSDWTEPDEQLPSLDSDSPSAANSDWSMDQLEASTSSQPDSDDSSQGEASDGWSMEIQKTNPSGTSNSKLRSPKSKKTEEGDWSMEEVEKK